MIRTLESGVRAPLFLAFLLALTLLLIGSPATPAWAVGAAGGAGAPDISGKAAILLDLETGRIIYERSADARRAIASTTKIMTAVVAMDSLSMEATTTVSAHACDAGESEAWLEPGEVLPIKTLLAAVMVRSGNDAAVALAEAATGSEEAFVAAMNAKAKELGLADSHFTNPHGLDAPEHYSSARDLATLGRYAMRNPVFRQIVAAPKVKLPPAPSGGTERIFSNRNSLIGTVDFVTGIKTGYTGDAGFCLVGSGEQDGVSLISVVLGAPTKQASNDDTVALLEYGFSKYHRELFAEQGVVLAQVPVPYHFGEQLTLATDRRLVRTLFEGEKVTRTISVARQITLPIRAGQVLGTVSFSVDGRPAGDIDLVATRPIEAPTLRVKLEYLWDRFDSWVGGLV